MPRATKRTYEIMHNNINSPTSSDIYALYHTIIVSLFGSKERLRKSIDTSNYFILFKTGHVLNYFCFLCTIGASANVQSNYSSALTKNNSIYSPDDCKIANHYYEAIQLSVSKSGCYNFISQSNVSIIGYIYIHSFDVFNPNSDWLVHHDGNDNNAQFNFTVQLETAIKYVLIVSTYLPDDIGNFFIIVSGASKVNFSRLSK